MIENNYRQGSKYRLDNAPKCPDDRRMTEAPALNWELVDAIAERLGVNREARKKWKQRNVVPYRWQMKIVQESAGAILWSSFPTKEAA
jgi:hypothetical protein